MLLQAGRRAQHLRQGEPRADQEQQEAQRPARRGRRLGAELQLDVLERRAAVVRGSRRGGWGCVAAAWRRAVRLTARVDQDAHVARCTFVRVHRHRTHGTRRRADRTHSGAVRCGDRCVVVVASRVAPGCVGSALEGPYALLRPFGFVSHRLILTGRYSGSADLISAYSVVGTGESACAGAYVGVRKSKSQVKYPVPTLQTVR